MLDDFSEELIAPELNNRYRAQYVGSRADINNNPELTLHLRVFFHQSDDDGWAFDTNSQHAFTANHWNPEEWANYKRIIINQSQRFWNGKFWLIPPAHSFHLVHYNNPNPTQQNLNSTSSYPAYSQRPEYIAGMATSYNVYCKVRITETAHRSNAHLVIESSHLNDSNFDQFINSVTDSRGIFFNGIIRDRNVGTAHGGTREFYQPQFIHEIGHAIGQRHVGFYSDTGMCEEVTGHASGAGHRACYEGDNLVEAGNIMGLGRDLSDFNAIPWLEIMARHTRTSRADWGIARHRVFPRIVTGTNTIFNLRF